MPLINLKSDLTSCKYGHDLPGGGDSGQPFIISYPTGDTEVNTSARNPLGLVGIQSVPAVPNFTTLLGRKKVGQFILDAVNGDEFIRGGGAGSLQASVNDFFRISAFLTSLPKGSVFLAKQVGLQLSNPKLEVKKRITGGLSNIFNPGGLLGTVTGGILQPTRIYNLGFNTLAQVPANAFGIHFNRHGLLPTQSDDTKYESIVKFNNEGVGSPNNRLVGLMNRFALFPDTMVNIPNIGNLRRANRDIRRTQRANRRANLSQIGTSVSLFGLPDVGEEFNLAPGIPALLDPFGDTSAALKNISAAKRQLFIGDYLSGPGSVYGIGRTLLKRYDFTSNVDKIFNSLSNSEYAGYSRDSDDSLISFYKNNNSVYKPTVYGVIGGQEEYIGYFNNKFYPNDGKDNVYRSVVFLSKRFGNDWTKAFRENNVGGDQQGYTDQDPLNLFSFSPLVDDVKSHPLSVKIGNNTEYNLNDFVPFRIYALNGDNPTKGNFMAFRAYLTQFSDSVDAKWNNVTYAGRGEDFYIYNGFSRKIQIGFKVAALSAEEMEPMYEKLNYLMSNLMPDYKANLLMRGPLVNLTVGNYIANQEGILNSLTYTVPNESPWEIEIASNVPPSQQDNDVEDTGEGNIISKRSIILPHILEVSLTFTPIGAVNENGENVIAQKGSEDNNIYNYKIGQPLYIRGNDTYKPTYSVQ